MRTSAHSEIAGVFIVQRQGAIGVPNNLGKGTPGKVCRNPLCDQASDADSDPVGLHGFAL